MAMTECPIKRALILGYDSLQKFDRPVAFGGPWWAVPPDLSSREPPH